MPARYCLLALVFLLACGTPTPMTTWPYPTWYARDGGSSHTVFDRDRRSCIDELETSDPEGIEHDSPANDSFLRCMNTAGWCNNAYHCHKPARSPAGSS
jgi:hypothetical protein